MVTCIVICKGWREECENKLLAVGSSSELIKCPVPGSRGPRKWENMISYHISKNSGTTLRGILQKRYKALELHGPKKEPYAHYFHSLKEKYRGHYFVVFVREPVSKLLSQFYYVRSSLSGAFGRWHRCFNFEEYIGSRRARHNHQFVQLMTDQKGCGPDHKIPRLRHEAIGGSYNIEQLCPGGLAILKKRIIQVLSQPRLFVGIVEHFDASLLALQREIGLPDVRYCPMRRHHNVLRVNHLPQHILHAAHSFNQLDNIIYNTSLRLFEAKRCCYGITDDDLDQFRQANLAFQHGSGSCPPISSEQATTATKDALRVTKDRVLSNDTLGNPMWRDSGRDCSDMRSKRIGLSFFTKDSSSTMQTR